MTWSRIPVLVLAVIHALFAGLTALVGAFANGGDLWQRLLLVLLHPLGAAAVLLLVLRPRRAAPKILAEAKNEKLKRERHISFEEIVFHIRNGDLLDVLDHPNQARYAGQRIFVVQRDAYAFIVPFAEDERSVTLKTIIPSRKATRDYLGQESDR